MLKALKSFSSFFLFFLSLVWKSFKASLIRHKFSPFPLPPPSFEADEEKSGGSIFRSCYDPALSIDEATQIPFRYFTAQQIRFHSPELQASVCYLGLENSNCSKADLSISK